MTRAIGLVCRAGERIITPELGKEHPSGRVQKVYSGGNSSDGTDVWSVMNSGGTLTHRTLQSGVSYFQAIEPIVATAKIGAGLE